MVEVCFLHAKRLCKALFTNIMRRLNAISRLSRSNETCAYMQRLESRNGGQFGTRLIKW